MGIITTSIVVNFGDTDSGILTAEIDDRDDGYNGGDTSFAPGETAAFLIYATSNVSVNTPIVSLGSVQKIASPQNIVKEEFVNFADTNKGQSQYPVMSGFSYEWVGRSLGAVTVNDQQNLVASTKGVAVLKITYTSQFVPWRLTNVPTSVNGDTSFPVLIFVSGVTS